MSAAKCPHCGAAVDEEIDGRTWFNCGSRGKARTWNCYEFELAALREEIGGLIRWQKLEKEQTAALRAELEQTKRERDQARWDSDCKSRELVSVHEDLCAKWTEARDNATAALGLVCAVRFALGDNGLRMQDELIAYCKELRSEHEERKTVHQWLDAKGVPTHEGTGLKMCLLRRLAVALGMAPHLPGEAECAAVQDVADRINREGDL
jgi:hypothetical protein